jgi:hypothetical protein
MGKRRRLIFNCDGFGVFKDAHGDLYRWIHNVFTGLEDSDVEALLWCDGAGGNTAYFDSQVLELTGQRIGQVSPFLRRLIDEGNDPPKVIVRQAKKRRLDIFYSFRLNDTHDDFMPEEYPTFKEQHPEWLIGEGHDYGVKTALNFSVPEVRQLKLAVVEEVFRKYDFDGLEIDFLRSPPYFIPGEEPQNAPVLTQFVRDVRQHLNKRAAERGRPVELAARVDENLEACRLDGFDVEAWVREGLVDILILGSGAIDIAIEEFKELVRGTGVLIYPCLYGWPSRYVPIPAELARGLAANYWHQGADGIYTFNWFPHEANKRYQVDLLSEIGDPQKLAGKPLMFAADRGRPQREYPHNWMRAVLPLTLAAGQETSVSVTVGLDLAKPRLPRVLGLRIECEGLSHADALKVRINRHPLPEAMHSGSWLTIPLAINEVVLGKNQVDLELTSGEITVTAVEIHVGY